MQTTMDFFDCKMFAKIFTILLTVALVHGTPFHVRNIPHDDYDGRPVLQDKRECEVNADCDAGRFCYLETYKCALCVDCASRYRQNGTWGCAEHASDCGDCLPGFTEVRLERGVQKESCMPVALGPNPPLKNTSIPTGSENMFNFVWFFAGIGGLSLFFVASFLINQWHRSRRIPEPPQELAPLNNAPSQAMDTAPPPYYAPSSLQFAPKYPEMPSAPTLDAMVEVDAPRDCNTNITLSTHAPIQPSRVEELFVQAVGYQPPNYVNMNNYTGDQSPPPSTLDESDDSLEDSFNDESTQGSEWTPNPNPSNAELEPVPAGAAVMVIPQVVGSTAFGTIIQGSTARAQARSELDEAASSQESQENDGEPCEKRPRSNHQRDDFTGQGASINRNNNMVSNQCNLVVQLNISVPGHRGDNANQESPSQPSLPSSDPGNDS